MYPLRRLSLRALSVPFGWSAVRSDEANYINVSHPAPLLPWNTKIWNSQRTALKPLAGLPTIGLFDSLVCCLERLGLFVREGGAQSSLDPKDQLTDKGECISSGELSSERTFTPRYLSSNPSLQRYIFLNHDM